MPSNVSFTLSRLWYAVVALVTLGFAIGPFVLAMTDGCHIVVTDPLGGSPPVSSDLQGCFSYVNPLLHTLGLVAGLLMLATAAWARVRGDARSTLSMVGIIAGVAVSLAPLGGYLLSGISALIRSPFGWEAAFFGQLMPVAISITPPIALAGIAAAVVLWRERSKAPFSAPRVGSGAAGARG